MNTVGIDTFLNATQAAPKTKPLTPSQGSGEFNDYLREAASIQQQPLKQRSVAQDQPTGTPLPATNQGGDYASSSEEQAKPTSEAAEEQTDESETDEVLLSVAAIAASAAEVVTTAEVPVVTSDVVTETAQIDATQAQPTQDTPSDLEQASANAAEPAGGFLNEAMGTDGAVLLAAAEAALSDDSNLSATPQGVTQQQAAAANNDMEKQAHAQSQSAAQQQPKPKRASNDIATKSDGESQNPDTTERKSSKSALVDKHILVEQLVAPVAATVAATDTTPETKLELSTDTGSTSQVTSTHSHAQQSSESAQNATHASNSDQDSRMPTVDRARFVQRVANAFHSAQQNDGHIQMRLSPPELGSLRIEIAVRHGVLTANLETETADARRVLLDNLPALRQRLAEQDIRIEKFDVDVRREGSQSDGRAGAQDHQAQQQSQRTTAQNRIRTSTSAEVSATRVPRPQTASADAGLDVRI